MVKIFNARLPIFNTRRNGQLKTLFNLHRSKDFRFITQCGLLAVFETYLHVGKKGSESQQMGKLSMGTPTPKSLILLEMLEIFK